MTMTTHETLISARALISNVDDWCQNYYALDGTGVICGEASPYARRWCAQGALSRVTMYEVRRRDAYQDAHMALCRAAAELFGVPSIFSVNDGRGMTDTPNECHAKVLAAYDRAIANTKASGATR